MLPIRSKRSLSNSDIRPVVGVWWLGSLGANKELMPTLKNKASWDWQMRAIRQVCHGFFVLRKQLEDILDNISPKTKGFIIRTGPPGEEPETNEQNLDLAQRRAQRQQTAAWTHTVHTQ